MLRLPSQFRSEGRWPPFQERIRLTGVRTEVLDERHGDALTTYSSPSRRHQSMNARSRSVTATSPAAYVLTVMGKRSLMSRCRSSPSLSAKCSRDHVPRLGYSDRQFLQEVLSPDHESSMPCEPPRRPLIGTMEPPDSRQRCSRQVNEVSYCGAAFGCTWNSMSW